MPDLYAAGDYDLAGTIVGIVERDRIVDGSRIREGDALIGFPSSGLHTNGYSLARRVLFRTYSIHDRPEPLGGRSIGDELLSVHRSYLKLIQASLSAEIDVRGMVHVTGGGIPGNTARVIPAGLRADFDYSAWQRPAVFQLIQETGNVPEEDMRRTFNLGIGLILAVPADDTEKVLEFARSHGERALVVGHVSAA